MTLGDLVSDIMKYQDYFKYSVESVHYITGDPECEIADSFDAQVVITSHPSYTFGKSVNTNYKYICYFRFNHDLSSVQISIDSCISEELIYLLLVKLNFRKLFIRTIINTWSRVDKNLFAALFSFANFSVNHNYPDVLNDILSTDWDSIVEELNNLYDNSADEPRFAVRQIYDYSDKDTVQVYDDGFTTTMLDCYVQKLINKSALSESSECTMILLRWVNEHTESTDTTSIQLRL